MPPRLFFDLNTDICPDYAGADWADERQTLALSDKADDQTVLRMVTMWNATNARQRVWWAAQVAGDEADAAEAARVRDEEAAQARLAVDQEADAQRREAEKKKIKLPASNSERPIDDFPTYEPSHFATNKLINFEYVELWYFSKEGCQDAFDSQHSIVAEGFGLTRADEGLVLKLLSTFQASKKVIKDTNLTWTQMSIVKTTMLSEMKKCCWAAHLINSLAVFYYALGEHPY